MYFIISNNLYIFQMYKISIAIQLFYTFFLFTRARWHASGRRCSSVVLELTSSKGTVTTSNCTMEKKSHFAVPDGPPDDLSISKQIVLRLLEGHLDQGHQVITVQW